MTADTPYSQNTGPAPLDPEDKGWLGPALPASPGGCETTIRQERRRLARELHNGPLQVLATVGLELAVCQRLARQGNLDMVNEELARLDRMVQRGIADCRHFIADLHESASNGPHALEALDSYLADYRASTGLDVALDLPDNALLNRLWADQQAAVLRVVQEAPQNAYKHAHATQIRLTFRPRPDGVEICIEDNGVGFDVSHAQQQSPVHLGLIGMSEWAEEAGGALAVESQPGQGSRVILVVPWPRSS